MKFRKYTGEINTYKLFGTLIISCFLFLSSGCNKEETGTNPSHSERTNFKETTTAFIKSLTNFEHEKIVYTSEKVVIPYSSINNVGYEIIEYNNENNKKFYYVIKLSDKELNSTEKENEVVPFHIQQISVGAIREENSKIFRKNATSPIYVDYGNEFLERTIYYLFESDKAIQRTDFRIDAFFVNAKPYSTKNKENIKEGNQTYHYIDDFKSNQSIISE